MESELKESIQILEDMCLRYGKPEHEHRTEEQIKEIKALNIILKYLKQG